MNTSMFVSRRFLAARLGTALGALALWVAMVGAGCKSGSEGDRCNPFLSHDECGGDALVCSGPSTSYPLPGTCVENYCCPKDPSKSADSRCNGADSPDCPVATAGDDDDTGAADGGEGDASSTADTSSADGDGVVTPAISVLGPVEGLKTSVPALSPWIVRNARNATAHFGIPPNRVTELGMQVEL